MRANLELGLSGKYDMLKAALIPSQCDTLKCVCENFKVAVPKVPVIGVTIPNNRTIQAAHGQLLDEFDYLSQALEQVQTADCRPMPLEEAFAVYEEYRAVMMEFTTWGWAVDATIPIFTVSSWPGLPVAKPRSAAFE